MAHEARLVSTCSPPRRMGTGPTQEPDQSKGVINTCLSQTLPGKDRRGRLRGFQTVASTREPNEPGAWTVCPLRWRASLSDLTAETLESSEINREGIKGAREAGGFEQQVVLSRPVSCKAGCRQFQHKRIFVALLSGRPGFCLLLRSRNLSPRRFPCGRIRHHETLRSPRLLHCTGEM